MATKFTMARAYSLQTVSGGPSMAHQWKSKTWASQKSLKRYRSYALQLVDWEVFIEYIDSLREIHTAPKYDLLKNNCNTFSNDVCQVS